MFKIRGFSFFGATELSQATATVAGVKVAPIPIEVPSPKLFGRRFLKVKIKSLAEESRIIRLEEGRAKGDLHNQLHNHRVHDVRDEARATLLAYNFIRGRSFAQTENKSKKPIPKERVRAMVKKYGGGSAHLDKELDDWYGARSED